VWLLVGSATLTGQRQGRAFLIEEGELPPDGFSLYVTRSGSRLDDSTGNWVELSPQLNYLAPGDVVSMAPDAARIKVLWRARSRQNSVLLTERCDNFCLMCSQPPKRINDDWLMDEALELIRLLPRETEQIGFTGGEPTHYGDKLIELLTLCKALLPEAGVHILSNGRRFADPAFTLSYAGIDNPNMMVGIPIYGAEPSLHDYVVQARGAFDDTIGGVLNLARLEQRIEIRVVVHKQTAPALIEIAEFITRNIPFVDQVALMGLEMMGFARANIEDVWIDPVEYAPQLTEATLLLDHAGIKTMIYNHQLCLIEERAWPFAVKSISDWKNEYHPECNTCTVLADCGGFFHSAKYRMSDYIHAIRASASSPC
jgi:His-Xaa-Ser system radical SAM maturase HxsC